MLAGRLAHTVDDAILQFGFDADFAEALHAADTLEKFVDIAVASHLSNEGFGVEAATPHGGHASS